MRVFLSLTSSILFALALHAIPRVSAHPLSLSDLSVDSGPRTDPTHSLSPSLLSANDEPLNNRALPRIRDSVSGFRKYIFPIEGTNLVLTIRLGRSLKEQRISLGSLLAVTEQYVQDLRARFGDDGHLPNGLFEFDLHDGIEFAADSPPELASHITFAILESVVHGLSDFLMGLKNYREAACQVRTAGPEGQFLGSSLSRRINVPINAAVYIDIRAQWTRLDLRAVHSVLVIARQWATDRMRSMPPYRQYVPNGHYEVSLFEGAELIITAAPRKVLTYELALRAFERLLEWEMNGTKGRAVQFGVLDGTVLMAAGSIKKGQLKEAALSVA
ncbi:MAG: hypothetical protein Q9174_001013 [Haloplaca sp. 1 TL-2023]